MRWDNVIFAYLFVTYLIFITLRGELPIYMGFLLSSASAPAPAASSGPVGGTTSTAGAPSAASNQAASTLGGMLGSMKTLAPLAIMGL